MKPILLALALSLVTPAGAFAFERIQDKTAFIEAIQNKELRLGLFNVTLQVKPDGRIQGSAMGKPVSGNWYWKDGAFCRDMTWGDDPIDYNCQAVDRRNDRVKFISDRGTGQSATFRLR